MYWLAALFRSLINPSQSNTLNGRLISELSVAVRFMSNGNKPQNSGDKGPEKNYKKKMMKKLKSDTGLDHDLMQGLRAVEDQSNTVNTEDESAVSKKMQ